MSYNCPFHGIVSGQERIHRWYFTRKGQNYVGERILWLNPGCTLQCQEEMSRIHERSMFRYPSYVKWC
jgi:hypothetical protein